MGNNIQIMVLDDDPFALSILDRQISSLGFSQALKFERSVDALSMIESSREEIHVILCDLQMPEMDGVEFIRELHRLQFDGGLVLITGEDKSILESAERLALKHDLNVLGAVTKPVGLEELSALLEKGTRRIIRASTSDRKSYDAEDLMRAMSAGELVMHYQPKVAVPSKQVIGVETLVRWEHPRDGLVYPDQFVPMAEECGIIDELTQVVLACALEQAAVWSDAGLKLQIAINVSMDNLSSYDFPDRLIETVRRAGVDSSGLVLEITESRLMGDPVVPLDILTRLRLKHISISIDDFGTGNSSLTQLRDIPFDELKIDRGFVHGASRDNSLRAIFDASLNMAKQLGMKVVAEGVEDEHDWELLSSSECDIAQGYFIAKPMPGEELMEWIGSWYEACGIAKG